MNKKQFFEQYEIDIAYGRLGGGAFGTVYKAYDHINSMWKAIKIGEVKYINGKAFSLVSEYNAVKDLPAHKNIANYEAVHQFHMPNGVFDYAIMQYYPEGNLKDLLKKKILTNQQKKEIAEGIIYGIQYLHSNKILHRDIKPSNILIARIKDIYTPKIADFGLSKFVDAREMTEITNSFGGGTLEYSSPEQLRGHTLRYNADLWATGVILYEIFIGKIPFDSDSFIGSEAARRALIYQNIDNARIPDEISLCPYPFDQIIARCLVKDPNKRIQTADELIRIINQKATISEETEIISTPFITPKPKGTDLNETQVLSGQEMEKVMAAQKAEKERLIREEAERIKAEEARKRKEEEERLLKEQEEKERLRKEEEERVRLQKEKEELVRKSREEERKRKEEEARKKKEAKEKVEQDRIEQVRAKKELTRKKKEEALRLEQQRLKKKEKRRAFLFLLQSFGKKIIRAAMAVVIILLVAFGANQLWNKYTYGPTLFEENGLYGYKDGDGNVIIPASYMDANPFKWGEARVYTDSLHQIIDVNGDIIESSLIENNAESITYNSEKSKNRDDSSEEERTNPINEEKTLPTNETEIANDITSGLNSTTTNNPINIDLPIEENEKITTPEDFVSDENNDTKTISDQPKSIDQDNNIPKEGSSDLQKEEPKTVNDKPLEENIPPALDEKGIDLVNSTTPKIPIPSIVSSTENNYRFIEGGSFTLGCDNPEDDCNKDEKPVRNVKMNGFYISQYEVTQKEFREVMGYNPSLNSNCDNCPVENVSWYDATKFINKLNQLPGNPYQFRLPTEAEWEYAASGGKNYIYAGSDILEDVAQYAGNNKTNPISVTRTKANDYGLRGMSGNVAEWVMNWYNPEGYNSSTGVTREKVYRGGSWLDRKRACRIKNRSSGEPELQRPTIGFRLIREKK